MSYCIMIIAVNSSMVKWCCVEIQLPWTPWGGGGNVLVTDEISPLEQMGKTWQKKELTIGMDECRFDTIMHPGMHT